VPPVLVDAIVLGISFLVDPDRDRIFRAHVPDNSLPGQLVGNGSSHDVAVGDNTTQPLKPRTGIVQDGSRAGAAELTRPPIIQRGGLNPPGAIRAAGGVAWRNEGSDDEL
jgi:hypothetical protein